MSDDEIPTNIANLLRMYPNAIITRAKIIHNKGDVFDLNFRFLFTISYDDDEGSGVAVVSATMDENETIQVGNKDMAYSDYVDVKQYFKGYSLKGFFTNKNVGKNPYILHSGEQLANISDVMSRRIATAEQRASIPVRMIGYINDIYYILDRLELVGIVKGTKEYDSIINWMLDISNKRIKGSGMTRMYSIDDIAKYKAKAGSGYGDWIANLNALQQGKGYVTGVPTPEYYIGDVPPQDGSGLFDLFGDFSTPTIYGTPEDPTKIGSGLKNNISDYNKMSKAKKKKFGNTDTQLFEGMLGGSMEEMGFDDEMEGGAWHDWLANLYNVIRNPKEALKSEPKPIREFNDKYDTYNIISMEICREPLSAGLQNIIDRASRGDLIKNLASSPYDALYHLYANVYLRHPSTGNSKTFRVEKNQRVEIFDKIVPPKGGVKGKCMGVPNIKPNTIWRNFWLNTDETTWNYSANKYNCQNFLKRRLEELNLLTPELKEFIMQDIDTLLPGAEVQKSIAKGITDAASILQNIWKGGEMGGDGHCGCEGQSLRGQSPCGCGTKKKKGKKGSGYVEPHKHDGQTWEVQSKYLEPNWWVRNRDYS